MTKNEEAMIRAVKAGQVLSHDEEEEPDTTGNTVMGPELASIGRSGPEYQAAKQLAEAPGALAEGAATVFATMVSPVTGAIEGMAELSKPSKDHLDRLNRPFGAADGVSALDVFNDKFGGKK